MKRISLKSLQRLLAQNDYQHVPTLTLNDQVQGIYQKNAENEIEIGFPRPS